MDEAELGEEEYVPPPPLKDENEMHNANKEGFDEMKGKRICWRMITRTCTVSLIRSRRRRMKRNRRRIKKRSRKRRMKNNNLKFISKLIVC